MWHFLEFGLGKVVQSDMVLAGIGYTVFLGLLIWWDLYAEKLDERKYHNDGT